MHAVCFLNLVWNILPVFQIDGFNNIPFGDGHNCRQYFWGSFLGKYQQADILNPSDVLKRFHTLNITQIQNIHIAVFDFFLFAERNFLFQFGIVYFLIKLQAQYLSNSLLRNSHNGTADLLRPIGRDD